MLFQPEHLHLIKRGLKTQTRRIWERKMVKVGGVYAAHNSEKGLFQKNVDAPFFILVKKVWKEQLGDISIIDAVAEGAKSREHFKRIWKEINGSWDPEQEVFAVKFRVAITARKRREFLLWNSQHAPDPCLMEGTL